MNKKFYFALALTVGLFASCSSDDLTAEAPQQQGIEVNDNEPAQIKISTGMATRGTGSVGFPTAQWDGQKFNLFMFQKGTFAPATYRATETDPETPIYLNTEMTTDPLTQTANYVLGGDIQYNYFPGNGAYSFWAYRIDDALDPAPAALPAQAYVYVDDTNAEVAADAATASKVVVPIDIDGSQDIMVAIADTATALTQLQNKVATATMDRIYTAYSARRAVNPQLSFQHLLTRLSFRVIADSREVSNAADWLTADPVTAGEEFKGFKITQVRVKTKSKGHVVAAFKDLSRVAEPRLVFDDGQDWALEADGSEPSTLKSVFLQTRDVTVDPARIEMKDVLSTYGGDVDCSAGYVFKTDPTDPTSATGTFTMDDALTCYTDNTLDANGMPIGVPTTVGAAKGAGVHIYFATYAEGTRADGSTYDNYAETTDKSAPLRPFNLANDGTGDDLIPHWTGYVAPAAAALAWHTWTYEITGYTWTLTTDAADIAVAVDAADAPTAATAGAVGDVKHIVTTSYEDLYYKCTAIIDNVTGATAYADQTSDPITDGAGGADGDIVYVGDGTPGGSVFYKYYAEGAAGVPGNAVATSIGEALLVAPADANGYFVEFTYKRYKRITDTHVEPITNTATIQVTSGTGFEAGKHYVITARLYKDGDIVIGGGGDAIKPVDWGNGGGAGAGGTDQDEWDLE